MPRAKGKGNGVKSTVEIEPDIGAIERGRVALSYANNRAIVTNGWTDARRDEARGLILQLEGLVKRMLSHYDACLASGTIKAESLPLSAGILLARREALLVELGNAAAQREQSLSPSDVLSALAGLTSGAPCIAVSCTPASVAQSAQAVAPDALRKAKE